jgi:hypothetical protein
MAESFPQSSNETPTKTIPKSVKYVNLANSQTDTFFRFTAHKCQNPVVYLADWQMAEPVSQNMNFYCAHEKVCKIVTETDEPDM